MRYILLLLIITIACLVSCKKEDPYSQDQGEKIQTVKAKNTEKASKTEWKNIHAVTDPDEKILDNRPFGFNSAFTTIESRIADRVVASKSIWIAENGLFVKLKDNSNAKLSTELRHGIEIFRIDPMAQSIDEVKLISDDWKNLCGISKLLKLYKFKKTGSARHLDFECERFTNPNPKSGPDEIYIYKGMPMLITNEQNGEIHRWIVTRFEEEALVQERMFKLPEFDLK